MYYRIFILLLLYILQLVVPIRSHVLRVVVKCNEPYIQCIDNETAGFSIDIWNEVHYHSYLTYVRSLIISTFPSHSDKWTL